MSKSTFLLAIKSTLDKLGNDLAINQSPPIPCVDLDDPQQSSELFANESNAIVISSLLLVESPRDPLYTVTFQIGARTVVDASNYTMLGLVGQVNLLFEKSRPIPIYNYAVLRPNTILMGRMVVTDIGVDDQLFEKMSGIRLLTVTAKASRLG